MMLSILRYKNMIILFSILVSSLFFESCGEKSSLKNNAKPPAPYTDFSTKTTSNTQDENYSDVKTEHNSKLLIYKNLNESLNDLFNGSKSIVVTSKTTPFSLIVTFIPENSFLRVVKTYIKKDESIVTSSFYSNKHNLVLGNVSLCGSEMCLHIPSLEIFNNSGVQITKNVDVNLLETSIFNSSPQTNNLYLIHINSINRTIGGQQASSIIENKTYKYTNSNLSFYISINGPLVQTCLVDTANTDISIINLEVNLRLNSIYTKVNSSYSLSKLFFHSLPLKNTALSNSNLNSFNINTMKLFNANNDETKIFMTTPSNDAGEIACTSVWNSLNSATLLTPSHLFLLSSQFLLTNSNVIFKDEDVIFPKTIVPSNEKNMSQSYVPFDAGSAINIAAYSAWDNSTTAAINAKNQAILALSQSVSSAQSLISTATTALATATTQLAIANSAAVAVAAYKASAANEALDAAAAATIPDAALAQLARDSAIGQQTDALSQQSIATAAIAAAQAALANAQTAYTNAQNLAPSGNATLTSALASLDSSISTASSAIVTNSVLATITIDIASIANSVASAQASYTLASSWNITNVSYQDLVFLQKDPLNNSLNPDIRAMNIDPNYLSAIENDTTYSGVSTLGSLGVTLPIPKSTGVYPTESQAFIPFELSYSGIVNEMSSSPKGVTLDSTSTPQNQFCSYAAERFVVNNTTHKISFKKHSDQFMFISSDNPTISTNSIIPTAIMCNFKLNNNFNSYQFSLLFNRTFNDWRLDSTTSPDRLPATLLAEYIYDNSVTNHQTDPDPYNNIDISLFPPPPNIYGTLPDVFQTYFNNSSNILDFSPFSGLVSIETLNLSKLHMANVPDKAFQNLVSLRYLYFNENDFNTLAPNLFIATKKLEYLNLYDTQISFLLPNIFSGLSKLTFLGITSFDAPTGNPISLQLNGSHFNGTCPLSPPFVYGGFITCSN
jgi:hypothetical protein